MRISYDWQYKWYTVTSDKKAQTVFHKYVNPKTSKPFSVFEERDGYVFVKFIKPLKLKIKNN